jgi:2-polyprenyl-3-methyl-5-hydroxy-6-metoxy-1,4-benzoquinol methylase
MDKQVVDSWCKNTAPWITAVREGEIESRMLATNQAIVDAVRSLSPASGLDIGCGEGWLVRTLDGVAMTGVDVVPGLVEAARRAGGGEFLVMSYEDIAQGRLKLAVDVAICNFSLIGEEAVSGLFRAARTYLKPGGTLIVQTMHPLMACGDGPYADGWREGSWAGFNAGFTDPPPWYFRTLSSWVRLFGDNGLQLRELREPIHPNTGKPASLILMGSLKA